MNGIEQQRSEQVEMCEACLRSERVGSLVRVGGGVSVCRSCRDDLDRGTMELRKQVRARTPEPTPELVGFVAADELVASES